MIESLNFSLGKIIKGRCSFPNDSSVYRLIYLGLEQISQNWTMPIKKWKAALQRFAMRYEDRLLLTIRCAGCHKILIVMNSVYTNNLTRA